MYTNSVQESKATGLQAWVQNPIIELKLYYIKNIKMYFLPQCYTLKLKMFYNKKKTPNIF